ncbi:MAG: HlyD family efflux transporter periplasmic adaptor subunit [Bacteroidota bacterium]
MDNLSADRLHEFNFIAVFFKILLAFVFLFAVGLFALRINDSVPLLKGELIAQKAQRDYKAAFEAMPTKVWVREGQHVKAGDTLAMLSNLELDHVLDLNRGEEEREHALLASGQDRRTNVLAQIQLLRRQQKNIAQQYKSEQKSVNHHLERQKSLLSLLMQKSQLAEETWKREDRMYQDQLISWQQLQESHAYFLNEQEAYLREKEEQAALKYQLELLKRTFDRESHDLALQIEQLEDRSHQLQAQDIEHNNRFQQAGKNIDFHTKKQEKLYLIAEVDGMVNFAFDIHRQSNLVVKDEHLFSIAPPNDAFVVKAYVDERKIKYLAKGQAVNLKLDAYDHYRYGVLKGQVQFIPDRKQEERFYILITLAENDRNFTLKAGYTLRGEVIIEQLRLYQYIVKKLFEQLDDDLG